jgi:non-specific serine/threonine protein kinase
LRDKQTLLVLDNFEQLLAASPQVAELVAVCPWLKILVTSRAPLRLRQERQIPVSPLALPDLAHLPDVVTVTQYAAVTLFLERAQAVKPDFSLTQENAPVIAAICTRLDGLPLAIELISARVKLLPPSALLERLHGRLMLQSDGLRDIEPRHRTLNAAIDWSYQLLGAEEQILFWRLAVFVGGWTLEAAESICTENLDLNILDGLASLLDKNLVKQDTRSHGEPRFMMLETIREYALERLTASGELDNLRGRHAVYFTAFAEHVGPDHVQWMNNLETELDNLRAALTSSATGLRLAVALGPFVQQRGHLSEASAWLTDALAQQESRTLTVADRTLRATALSWLGTFCSWQGDLDAAERPHEESVVLFRELGDRAGLAESLSTYGMLFVFRSDHERATPVLEESLALSREIRNTFLMGQCLLFLGSLAFTQGHIQQAGALWEESLALRRADHNRWHIAITLAFLAMVEVEQGHHAEANSQLVESLTLLQELGEKWQTAHTLEVFACLAVMQAQPNLVRAAHIFGAAEVFRETLIAPVLSFQRNFIERGVATLRAQLDDVTFATAWGEGRAMSLEQVVAYALEI